MPDEPLFSSPLHVGRPNVGDRSRLFELLNEALDRLWLTDGPLVREFEQRLVEVTGADHCVAVVNATVGIQLAARACGIGPGDEVIVPSFTWVATAHALSWIGVVPVFCDIDQGTGNIDPEHLERVITASTKGIVAVHVFGRPCPIAELTAIAERHGIPLIFDAAHGLGSTYGGVPLGGFGAAEVLSFHATKFLNSFEGGAVVTNDPELAARVRAMRNFGIDPDRDVVSCGTNGKMNEGVAAMGLTSLEVMDELIKHNLLNYELYLRELAGVPGVTVREQAPDERSNNQYLVIEVDGAVAGLSRDEMCEVLHARNVMARRYFHPACHEIEPYKQAPGVHAPLPLPHSEALAERVLALPTGTSIGEEEIIGIAGIIRDAVTERGARVRR